MILLYSVFVLGNSSIVWFCYLECGGLKCFKLASFHEPIVRFWVWGCIYQKT
jgi:hypothetical protein